MIPDFKLKALKWASQFEVCCLLDNHEYPDRFGKFDWILAADQADYIDASEGNFFSKLEIFHLENPNYLFGFFGFDLKNQLETLNSFNKDYVGFPDGYFFKAKYVIASIKGEIKVLQNFDDKPLIEEINNTNHFIDSKACNIDIKQRISRAAYYDKINAIKRHIARGDIYEITFCQEFYAEHVKIDPLKIYLDLTRLSPVPFACFFKLQDRYIISASPERFLKKEANTVISQPIKGTIKRSKNPIIDEKLKLELRDSQKEQAENVMIVDLVRNDLTRIAVPCSVKVQELFGIYTFPTVHQMISTITCKVAATLSASDIIKACFPMGSMTGAPKIRALQLIEEYEASKRGVFSGSVGYISPKGDFDLNVIIRSILYNRQDDYLSFQVGGAITHQSIAEKEYEECLLKAQAIFKVLIGTYKDATTSH